jgi:hypothetical protein
MDPKLKEILLEFIGAVRLLTEEVAKLNLRVMALEHPTTAEWLKDRR